MRPTDCRSCCAAVLRRYRGTWMTTSEIARRAGFTREAAALALPKIHRVQMDARVRPTRWRIGMRPMEIMEREIDERLTSEAVAGEPVAAATMREVLLRIRVAFDVLALHGVEAAHTFMAGARSGFDTIPLQEQGVAYASVGWAQIRDAVDAGRQYGAGEVTSAVADIRRAYALRRTE